MQWWQGPLKEMKPSVILKHVQHAISNGKKLIDQGCWDTSNVRSWREVCEEPERNGETVHIGEIYEICVEKGSELPPTHRDRKFKGRAVFLGDRVRGQYGDAAMFQELSSAPAALEAAKFCDAYGLLDGHVVEQSDAKQAYCQAELKGNKTCDTTTQT